LRRLLIATCASLILATLGAALAPTKAQAQLACSFNASGSPIGTLGSGNVELTPCYPGSLGFAGFTTTNNVDLTGNSVVTSPPGVGFQITGPNVFVASPTTLTSGDHNATVLFNEPGASSTLFATLNFTVLSTDGSSSAVFSFFCDGKSGTNENFVTDTACNVTIQLPAAAAVTAAVSASQTTVAVGATSTLTFTLSNPNSGTGLSGLSGVADSVTLPSGVTVASTPNASSTCGSFSPTAGATSLSVTGGTLPAGGSCTFKVEVTPSTSGSKTIPTGTSSATGAATGVAGTSATLTVNQPLSTTQAVPSTTLTVGSAATSFMPVTASGGTGTLSYALSGGTLPTGLNFSTATGKISGTPSTALTTTTFTATVTDQTTPTPATSSKTFNLTVNPALTTTQAVPSTTLTVGSAATPFTPVTATGGTGTLSYALSGGTLPTGLNFSTSTGQISGTPSTTLTTTTFTVTVTDQTTPTAQTSSKTFSLRVNPGLTTTQAVPSTTLTVGSAATTFTPVTSAGGTGTLSYALTGGTLPAGLNFSTATGRISGTPSTTLTTTTFTVTVTDQTTPTSQTSSKAFNLAVNAQLTTTQAVSSTTLAVGSAATPFTPVTAAGGTGTLSYALSGGTLPTGLNFSTSTGQISGTPSTTLTTTTFTVTVTDQTTPTPQTSSKTFSLTVSPGLTTTQAVASTTLAVGSAATPFTPVTAAGGTGTLAYALSGGTLPTGLNFSTTTGQISGTPSTTLTTTTFTVTVTDQTTLTPQTSSKTFSLTVNAQLTTTQAVPSTTLTVGSAATPFTPVTAAGGTGTLSYALSGGTVPTGLNFSTSTGQVSGTPSTTLTTTTFTVTVTDQTTPTPQTSSKAFNLAVNAQLTTTQAVSSTTLAAGSAATPFTPVTAAGGTGTLSYALSGGTLPTGLNFSTVTGQISGTPSPALTTTTFTVTVTDQTTPTPQTSSKTFGLTVIPALTTTQAVPSTTLTVGSAATPFTPVTAAGGAGTLNYALSGGTLPTGLTFSTSTGQISGTPSAALATTTFSVTVTDQTTPTAQTSLKTFSLTVNGALTTTQAVPSTTLTLGSAATPFTPVTASGGTGTLSYALSGGTLPTGLTFSTSTGQISGTPSTTLATTTFTVTVTDQTTPTPQTSSKTFSLTVSPVIFSFTPAPGALPGGVAGTPYSQIVTAPGGANPYTYSILSGALPAGLSLNTSTGVISGTPTTVGNSSFTVSVRDAHSQTGSAAYTLNVTAPALTAVSSSATAVSAVTVTVDLTVGATGGPFTSAQLLSLSPPAAGSAVITLGDTASSSNMVIAALVAGGHYLLKFTPAAMFRGAAVATFTLSNAFATSAPATITFTVVPRPDPSKDPEVIGLVNAQAQSAQHFASTQITNFNDRLESLHDTDCHRNSFHLGLTDSRTSADTDPLQRLGVGVRGDSGSNNTGLFGTASNDRRSGDVWGSDSAASSNSDGTRRTSRRDAAAKKHETGENKPNDCDDEATKRFAAWTGGFVNFGKLSTGGNSAIDYLNAGVSAGVDYRFSPSFIAGFGFGYGNDKSTIGSNGTVSSAFSYDVAVYGSWRPSRYTFIDALIGYGIMNFDSNRYIAGSSGEFAAGKRSGHQVFGSLTSGYEYRASGFLISPYGRLRASWSMLDAFTETGGGFFALQYGAQSISSFTAGFGLRASYEFREPWGAITPRMRIEYAHEFAGGSTASIAYADLVGAGGAVYTLPISPTGSDYVITGIGTDIRLISDWIFGIDYRTAFGQEKIAPQMIQIKLGTKF
jgi:uncharacterized protein YhjY with autotransporter beta-barrel domain